MSNQASFFCDVKVGEDPRARNTPAHILSQIVHLLGGPQEQLRFWYDAFRLIGVPLSNPGNCDGEYYASTLEQVEDGLRHFLSGCKVDAIDASVDFFVPSRWIQIRVWSPIQSGSANSEVRIVVEYDLEKEGVALMAAQILSYFLEVNPKRVMPEMLKVFGYAMEERKRSVSSF